MPSETFIDYVSDPMLALEGDVVREANAPACDLFGIRETFEGNTLSSLLAEDRAVAESYDDELTHYSDVAGIVEDERRHFERDHPAIDALLAGEDPEDADPDIGVFVDGSLEYYHLTTSALDAAPVESDRLVTFRKITHLKDRERDLDFLMQVMTRVLRHNLRNDLTVARGYAATIEEQGEQPLSGMAAQVRETCADLVETSEKARRIQKAITSERTVQFSLQSVLSEATEEAAADAPPEAEFALDVPDLQVLANPELPRALADCIENGAVYSDADTPRVEITAQRESPWLRLEIADNGPGIPEKELDALTERGETDLVHGSGAGLWLTHTVVEESGGKITYDTGDDGTTVRMRLPVPDGG